MKCEALFKEIDDLTDEYIGVWEDVCSIESPTDYKAGVDAVGNYFTDKAKKNGWKVDVLRQPVSGNAVSITMNPDAAGLPVSISGHLDTVHKLGAFGTPAVKRDEKKIYGPGVMDCKGGIVAGLLAMTALQRCGFTARPVNLLLQSDEEVGSKTSNKETIKFICEKAKNSVAFLNLEGHTEGEACLIRKGIARFTFVVSGIEAHSSGCALKGANAIAEASYKIIELEKLKDPEGITCNCGVIAGGTVANTVPGRCEFIADVRFSNSEEFGWAKKHLQKIADDVHVKGCSCKITDISTRVAMEYTVRNAELLERMNQIYYENGLPVLKGSIRAGGSDAADVTAYGIPCIDSIGVTGGKIHSTEEFANISSLSESAKRIAAVIYCI